MQPEDEIFGKRVPNKAKLLDYGFNLCNGHYQYQTSIMDDQFLVRVVVADHHVLSRVFDAATGDEYVLAKVERQVGSFASQVKANYRQVLVTIADQCFDRQPFRGRQANALAKYTQNHFKEPVEFPFAKLPSYGVFRNHQTGKWYGLIMNIPQQKLNNRPQDANQEVEILDLKIGDPKKREQLLSQPGFYPSYHMHQATWITINLDGTVTDRQVMELLTLSRSHTTNGRQSGQAVNWLIPANPHYYDIAAYFKVHQETIWKQSSNVRAGDIVYLYVTAPVKAIRYRCQVTKADIPYQYTDDNVRMTKVMRLKVLTELPASFCPFKKLKELGIKAVRGPQKLPTTVLKYLGNG